MSEKPVDRIATLDMMKRYGGGFVSALADAWILADPFNDERLRRTFPEYWHRYEEMARRDQLLADSRPADPHGGELC